MRTDVPCARVCATNDSGVNTLTEADAKTLISRIRDEYHVNLYVSSNAYNEHTRT
jgi:hypothetical protein